MDTPCSGLGRRPYYRTVTYYEVLGVDSGASAAEIRRAFLRLARVHHPDRNANATDEERRSSERRMQLINEAWAVLGDEERRIIYDHDRRMAARPSTKPRRTPGTANPDFVPYDTEDDEFDPSLLDDTPYSSTPIPRWLQLLAPGLGVAAVAFGSFALVTSFPPFFGLAVVSLIGSLLSFLVTPMLVVLRSSRRN
jgi:curved DNA-binding protein CbpA